MKTINEVLDYIQVENILQAIGEEYGRKCKTPFEKKAVNFITNWVVYRGRLVGTPFFFELSYGTGMSRNYIYGVTFCNEEGGMESGISQCCHSFLEVRTTLENVLERSQTPSE